MEVVNSGSNDYSPLMDNFCWHHLHLQATQNFELTSLTYCFFVLEVGKGGSNDYSLLMDKFQLVTFAFAGLSKGCVNQSLFQCLPVGLCFHSGF